MESQVIPNLRRRVDRTEEAREWNAHRDAILSMYNRAWNLTPDRKPSLLRHGFLPKFFGDSAGIGLHPGYVQLIRSPRYFSATSPDREAEEIMPTLGGTALNAATPPRESLADGDWEAWLEFQEREPGESLAVIDFTALGAGPGTLRRDEKAFRLCSFAVVSNRVTKLYDQFVADNLPIYIDDHQWRAIKTADTTIKVNSGYLCWPEGTQGTTDGIVGSLVTAGPSASFTITAASSIWLQCSWDVTQISAIAATDSAATFTLKNYKIGDLYSPSFSLRAAASPPSPGADTGNLYASASNLVWFELCQLTLEDGQAQVTAQCHSDTLFVSEMAESKLEPADTA